MNKGNLVCEVARPYWYTLAPTCRGTRGAVRLVRQTREVPAVLQAVLWLVRFGGVLES